MFTSDKPLPPPPPAARPRNESLAANMPSYRNRPNSNTDSSGFSFASTKSLFESMNKPEIRSGLMNIARNPTVQKVTMNAAKNEKVRSAAISAAKDPNTRDTAISAAQTPAGRGAILGLAKQFENKPVMGFGQPPPPSSSTPRQSWNTPAPAPAFDSTPSPRDKLYPSLTGDSAWQNRGPAYDTYSSGIYSPNPPAPSYNQSTSRPRSTDPTYNALVDELFPIAPIAPSKKAPPARPPPPKLGSRSIPNLSSFSHSSKSEQITEPHATVKYPYKSDKYDELNCDANDTVLLKREVDDQWIFATNTRTGQSGIVPISFLNINVPLVPTASSMPTPSFAMPPAAMSPSMPMASSFSTYTGFTDGKSHPARAMYDYDTGVDGDLKFKAGDIINVIERIDVEWLRGECNYHRGIFPLNYVDIDDITSIPMAQKEAAGNNFASSFATLSFKPKFVTAIYHYYSGVPEDLVFGPGDKIQIIEEIGNDWIKGSLDGREGLVPLTYVERDM